MVFRTVRLVDVLEAAYARFDEPTDAWLKGVLESVREGFDQGLGVQGYLVDASEPDRFDVSDWQPLGVDPPAAAAAAFAAWREGTTVAFKRRVHSFAPFGTSAALPPDIDGTPEVGANGYPAIIGLNGLDATGRGLAIAAASNEPIPVPPASIVRLWSRVAVHVATAARLRREAGDRPIGERGEAVVEPNGKVVDATGAARDVLARGALREAARGIDRARSRAARDDVGATMDLWQALVGGRWSLVDSFESDGRRYLVAVPNEPVLGELGALTERERRVLGALALGHANKLIAYELGVAVSTVATYIARAQKKLGVESRVELVKLLASRPELIADRSRG